MDKAVGLAIAVLMSFMLSCAQKGKEVSMQGGNTEPVNIRADRKEFESINAHIEPKRSIPPPVLMPTYRGIDPFEGKKFTMSAVDAPLTKVLYSIADDAGLNLVISPEVDLNRTITATFRNTPLRDALEVVMELSGLHYEVKGNVLFVKEILTKTFKLPYINTNTSYSGELGGNVAAGSGGNIAGATGTTTLGGGVNLGGGIGGSFRISFQNPEGQGDFYAQLEANLQSLLDSERGESYVLNRFTGTLIVRARKNTLREVEELISRVKREIKKQVLIEAKIVEVNLSDSSRYGVDWNRLLLNVLGSRLNLDLSQTSNFQEGFFTLRMSAYQFSAVLRAISEYGKTKILANPRIVAINGQPALITAGVSIPFFRREVQTLLGGGLTSAQQVNVRVDTVLDGVMLGVVPFIEDNGDILLKILPITSRLAGERRFPETGTPLANAPILNIKEAGTMVRVRDGDMVVIGGLIDRIKQEEDRGVPILKNVPVVGKAFKEEEKFHQVRELVIFLRPTVVRHDTSLD